MPATSSCTTPVPSPASQSRPTLVCPIPTGPSDREPERLDHRAGIGPPQPGTSGDDRMRRGLGQRAAGERQAIGDETCAERRQELVGAGHGAGIVDQPGESGG